MIRRAFTLIEVMIVITVLGFAVMLAGMVFSRTVTVSRHAAKAESLMPRLDRVIDRLRDDVWDSRRIAAEDDHTLVLRQADGRTVTWRTSASEGRAERVVTQPDAAEAAEAWDGLPRLAFAADEGTAEVTISGDELRRPVALVLICEWRAVRGLTR